MKRIITLCLIALMLFTLCGCTESDRVNVNISVEADNFNVLRRLTVINMRSDKPIFELVAYFSLSNNLTNELVVTCETGNGIYKKHYVYLNELTMYVIEDLSGASVSPYYYEINFLPEMIPVFGFTSNN